MSVTKDGSTGRWMSQIRVTDWTGKVIHKKKRGFQTKKEALQWERDFLSQSAGSLGMMLMCHKVTHKNLIDSSPLFRYCLTHASCNFFVKTIDSDTSKEI